MTELDALIAEFLLPLQLSGIDCSIGSRIRYSSPRGRISELTITVSGQYVNVDLSRNITCGQVFHSTEQMLAIVAMAFQRDFEHWKKIEFIAEYMKAYHDAYLERNNING